MKVRLYTETEAVNGKIEQKTLMIEDDGTPDGRRIIATFPLAEDAVTVAKAMGWHTNENHVVSSDGGKSIAIYPLM